MEVKNEFNVSAIEDKVVVLQKIIKTMTIEESMKELEKMAQEFAGVEKQKEELQKYIDEETAQKNMKAVQENIDVLSELKRKWEEAAEPLMVELKKKAEKKVKELKLERGYMRKKEPSEIAVARHSIMGDVANSFNLDVQHPLVKELRANFEKI
jgi:hypothetical protein